MAVRVNGELISDERFYREFLAISGGLTPEQMQQRSPADYRRAQELAERNVLRAVLLRQLAHREALAVTEKEIEEERRAVWGSAANQSCGAGVMDEMAERAAVRKAERHITRHVPRPSRAEIEAIYRGNPGTFTLPERWLVSHIVRLAEDEAERQAARGTLTIAAGDLKRGKSFAAVAERHSDCKGNGGSMGWISRGNMVPEFEEAVFILRPRKFSEIFQTPFGLHIALVQEHKPAGLQPLEEIRADLARRIFDDRRQATLDQALHDIFSGAEIQLISQPERSVASGEIVR
jgi:peptidyl-prolyl cis-trans isomerase C